MQTRTPLRDQQALIDRLQDELHSAQHRLAAETLRADLGWLRYEEANTDRNNLRNARVPKGATPAEAAVDPLACEHRWQGWPIAAKEGTEWCATCKATRDEPWTFVRELARLRTEAAARNALSARDPSLRAKVARACTGFRAWLSGWSSKASVV